MGISKSVGGSIKNSKRSIILYLNPKQPLNSEDVSYPCKLIQKPACRFHRIGVLLKGASCTPFQGSQKRLGLTTPALDTPATKKLYAVGYITSKASKLLGSAE